MEGRKKTILVIDDDEKLLMTTKELLENEGYKVLTHMRAFGATAAVGLIKPDLVLLDINMPGLSGDRLAYLLRSNEKTRDVPVVFYSSNDEDTLRRAVTTHKVSGYIAKGDIFDLRKKVSCYLDGR
ncbi:MAG: response regulator [Actinomycetota bacterium]|nr:response regulator [Actinomycetota bacterium]